MSDAPARHVFIERVNNFLRWLPDGVGRLPNAQYRRLPPFRRDFRDQADAIVADVASFLPGQAVLIKKAMDRFYGTIDSASIPPSENVAYRQVVLTPLRRYARELETMLTEVRDWVKKTTPPTPPAAPDGRQAADRLELQSGAVAAEDRSKYPWGNDDPETPLTPAKLADRLKIPADDKKRREALRSRLRSWRDANPSGGWIEVADRKPKQAAYIYPLGKVWSVISNMKPSG
jgi:hypothetical protein